MEYLQFLASRLPNDNISIKHFCSIDLNQFFVTYKAS